jgi:hypothetical protein
MEMTKTQNNMTHEDFQKAVKSGNTQVVLTCARSGKELICTIVSAGAKRVIIKVSEYYSFSLWKDGVKNDGNTYRLLNNEGA